MCFLFLLFLVSVTFVHDSRSQTISCCYVYYMENLIPDPFNNFRFYQCTPEWAPDQNRYHVFARVKDCAMGPNGEPLAYDIRHCKCMHRDEAVCFNPAIHGNREFFNCSTPYEGPDNECQ